MIVQWYPGHMAKAKRAMQDDIKLVDMVAELLDARAPLSSRNPDIDKLAANKLRMVILNKADLADDKTNRMWKEYFQKQGIQTVILDARKTGAKKQVMDCIMEAAKPKFERDRAKGIINRPVRVMVAGIPNVGKSTLINSIAGKACTKTGNKPGVTRGNQWIRLNKQVELLDTPGILWPKFEDQRVGEHLAFLGSVNDEIIQLSDLAAALVKELFVLDKDVLEERFGITDASDPYKALEQIAAKRAALKKGGELDTDKACRIILDEFRTGKLGRISLESPVKEEK